MATRKSRIDPASIDLLGRKADAKKLASYAAQAGAAARQPSRASFFAHCVRTIRERTGQG